MKKVLGSTVRDVITGFIGVVTGRAEYISGCNQALVAPRMKADGTLAQSEWFDEQRLEDIADVDPVVLDNGSTPGCDRPAPRR